MYIPSEVTGKMAVGFSWKLKKKTERDEEMRKRRKSFLMRRRILKKNENIKLQHLAGDVAANH